MGPSRRDQNENFSEYRIQMHTNFTGTLSLDMKRDKTDAAACHP